MGSKLSIIDDENVCDYVFPDKNESEFVDMAKSLGYEMLVMIYPNSSGLDKKRKELLELFKKSGVKIKLGVFGSGSKADYCFVSANDKLRDLIMRTKADVVMDVEKTSKRDFMHHRNSGLNHILCKLAKEKKKAFAINFSDLLHSDV